MRNVGEKTQFHIRHLFFELHIVLKFEDSKENV